MKTLKFNRRNFLSSLGAVGITLANPFTIKASEKEGERQEILKTGPYLQAPLPTEMTVRWITNVPGYSWVTYGTDKEQLNKKAMAVANGLVQAYNKVHAIALTDLDPGQRYYYRIHTKAIVDFQPYKVTYGETFESEVYSFQTPSHESDEVSFIVLNDIHDRPESFTSLLQYQDNRRKDFVLLNGDMFDHQEDEDQLVNHLLNPLSENFASQIPFIFACGNHETRGKFSRHLPDYFNATSGKKFYFSFQIGPAYIIVLDSGEDKPDDTPVYAGLVDFDNYRVEQARWLEEEVKKKEFKSAQYRVVFSHIPLFYAGNWHGTTHCRKVWGEILNQAKIDVLISGHTHKHGIHLPHRGQHNYPIVIGGGPHPGQRTIIQVKATREAFNLNMLDDQGKLVGELKL